MLPGIMDFEASGFGPESYPIEVGYVLPSGDRYCSLIRPLAGWQYWEDTAERLHGITRERIVASGTDANEVCLELNERLAGLTLYSDGWVVDKMWLDRLFYGTGLMPTFYLSPIEAIQSECQHSIWDKVRQKLLRQFVGDRHRASWDAQFIQQVFAETREICRTHKDTGISTLRRARHTS